MSGLNQTPQTLFQIEQIQDPAVRNNFQILNQELSKRRQNQQPPASNIVYSPELGTVQFFSTNAAPYYPAQLVGTINSKGNPISVKLAAASISAISQYYSIFQIFCSSGNEAAASIGLSRTNLLIHNSQPVNVVTISLVHQSVGASSVAHNYSFPVFEFTDQVAAGSWQYKFFLIVSVANNSVAMASCQLVIKEG